MGLIFVVWLFGCFGLAVLQDPDVVVVVVVVVIKLRQTIHIKQTVSE